MPGTFCAARRRRLAPVPCCVRSYATNFMLSLQMAMRPRPGAVTAGRVGARQPRGCRFRQLRSEVAVLLGEQRGHGLAVADAPDRLREEEPPTPARGPARSPPR